MRPETQPDFAKREKLKPKSFFFFAQHLSNSDPVLNKPMQLKCIAKGAEPPSRWVVFEILLQNQQF